MTKRLEKLAVRHGSVIYEIRAICLHGQAERLWFGVFRLVAGLKQLDGDGAVWSCLWI